MVRRGRGDVTHPCIGRGAGGLVLAAIVCLPGCTEGGRTGSAVAESSRPAARSDEYEIAFTSRRDGYWTIFSVDQDGSIEEILDVVSVEQGPPRAWLDFLGQVSWAPDGSRFAFTCVPRGLSEICVADAEGTVLDVLTEDAARQDTNPHWSADGEGIYYSAYRKRTFDVYFVTPNGSGKQRVFTGPEQTGLSGVSPDGRMVAYRVVGENRLEIARLSEREPEVIHSIPSGGTAAWSPDGRRIAFSRARDDLYLDLYLLSVDTGELTELTRSPGLDIWPSWSPDGRKIAFARDSEFRGGTYTVSDIYVVDVATGEITQLTDDPDTDMQPAWRPVPAAEETG